LPQAPAVLPAWQAPFASQQPPAHEVASQPHEPPVHDWPLPQGAACAPALPHEPFVCEPKGTHSPPAQQPFGHEAASQAHWPFEHAWPVAQLPQAAPP
jgi:hypothetical protein